jgi:glycosyltransferase involved in cell wall biosynthesis
VVGPVILADGIGKQSIELIEALQNDTTISTVISNSINKSTLQRFHPKVQKALQFSGITHPGKVLIFEHVLAAPSDLGEPSWTWKNYGIPQKNSSQIRLAYSMCEMTRISAHWVKILNNNFDGVLVPDPFLVDVYKNSGVKIPVFVLPLGINLHAYLTSPLKKAQKNPFVFANFSACLSRKNTLKLVQAFAQAFGNNPKVQLYLSWRLAWEKDYRSQIFSEIKKLGLNNVIVSEQCLNPADYAKRWLHVDCYISLSKGEGFSIQPRESMALGIPTIVTNSTGQKTICKSGLVRVVPCNNLVPASYGWFKGVFGNFEDCTVSDAAIAMQDVYNNYQFYLEKSEKMRKWAQQYHYPNLREMYLSVVIPHKVILGDTDIIETNKIITTSPALRDKYTQIVLNKKTTKKLNASKNAKKRSDV